MRISIAFISALLLFGSAVGVAEPLPYRAGKVYCSLTHPAEYFFKLGNKVSTCEEQHVIQQQSGGEHAANIVWWPASYHVRTDVASTKPWELERPWFVVGFTEDNKINLEKAYMLGTHGIPWSIYQHSFQGSGDSSLVAFEFDGASNLLYCIAWIINIPQKYIHQTAYLVENGHWHLLLDMVMLVFVLMFEVILACLATVFGVVVGTVLNPLDTLLAIPGGLLLLGETFIAACYQTLNAVWILATSSIVGLVITPFAIIGGILPVAVFSRLSDS